ncbi:hypothetical protein FACS18948_3190 [Clostridia bacterium]|nr:hypothetical protein FACS18948_3190 [Clostridia bacterium]
MSEWIRCSERMPQYGVGVLCYTPRGSGCCLGIGIYNYHFETWRVDGVRD